MQLPTHLRQLLLHLGSLSGSKLGGHVVSGKCAADQLFLCEASLQGSAGCTHEQT